MRELPRPAVLLVGALAGFWGLGWGLPSRERVDRILPPGVDGPELHERLSSSWRRMHERLGRNLMLNPDSYATFTGVQRAEAGWRYPPDLLANSVRSFYVRSEYEDEQTALLALSRMRPRELNLNPHFFTYGGAYLYPLAVWEALGAVVGAVELHTSLAPYLADPAKMAGLYYWGRVMSALFFLGCGLLLLRVGSRLGAGTGSLAALLFFLSPAAIIHAHSLKNHIVWTFFALLTLERCQAVLKRGAATDYAWAGAAAGLTTGAFLMGWPACLVVAVAALVRRISERGSLAASARGLAIAAVCAAAAFFASNPYWILSLGEALQEMKALSTFSRFDWTQPVTFVAASMRRSITTPVLLLVLAGAAVAARRGRRDPDLLLVLGAFLVGLIFACFALDVRNAFSVRYGLGWVAVGMLLAARAAVDALGSARARLRPALAAALAAVVLNLAATGATYAHAFRVDEGTDSNHYRAGAWIEENIPAGSSIGMLRLPQPSNAPYFKYHLYDLRFIEPRLFGGLESALLPRHLAVTVAIRDDRPDMLPNLARYERVAVFERRRLFPWIEPDPASSNADPLIEIYRLLPVGGSR